MLAAERHKKILEKIERNGSVQTGELIKELSVTGETLRKDMILLENRGLLRRTHGGAIALRETITEKRRLERKDENETLKRELSEYAVGLVKEGDVIALEAGTTADAFAAVLAENFNRLTIITNSLSVHRFFTEKEGIKVILTGGESLAGEEALYGLFALESLSKLHVSKAFICPLSLSTEFGASSSRSELYPIAKAMMKVASRTIILADSTKFDKNACFKICDLSPEITIVTDSGLSQERKKIYEKTGVAIIVAPLKKE